MCETCNLFCGGCRPARLKAVLCPNCGKAIVLSRDECLTRLNRKYRKDSTMAPTVDCSKGLICAGCKTDLMPALEKTVEPLPCIRSGILCGWPCGLREKPLEPGEQKCQYMVPMAKL